MVGFSYIRVGEFLSVLLRLEVEYRCFRVVFFLRRLFGIIKVKFFKVLKKDR